MMTRILLPLLVWVSSAACGEAGAGRASGRVRLDTAAGYRLGMLLPEARAAAFARGQELRCRLATSDRDAGSYPDSLWREMGVTELCDAGSHDHRLAFHQGSLRGMEMTMSDDWDFIPVDTLVGRLSRDYGKPWKRITCSTGRGRAEELITWRRDPALMMLRCPDAAGAGQCTREHVFLAPEPGEETP
ncbi:MAG TPA: hypothetical protein VHG93_15175 [Longimicrobium sp.]|nr:hypothetical protein [Longimicrobium sp.]